MFTSSIKLEIRDVAAVQSTLQRNVPKCMQRLSFCLFMKLLVFLDVLVKVAVAVA